jgi:hypothetical protein
VTHAVAVAVGRGFAVAVAVTVAVAVAVGVLVALAVAVSVSAGEPVAVVNGVQARRRSNSVASTGSPGSEFTMNRRLVVPKMQWACHGSGQ